MAKKINPDDFRHRITFQEAQKTPDGSKGFTVEWTFVAEVWASVEPVSGRERFFSQQIKAEVTHKVKIRYKSGITEAMRILHRERVFLIESIIDINERQEFIEIRCMEEK